MKKNFFNTMAGKWDDMEQTAPEKLRRVAEEADLAGARSVLDAGSGTGILIPLILEKNLHDSCVIQAIDYAEEMVSAMESKNFPSRVVIEQADIHQTPYREESFDRVIANSCFPHFEDRSKALGEIFRILKPGGIFILSHPDGRKLVNDRHKKMRAVERDILPPASELGEMIEAAGFRCLKLIDEEEFYLIKCLKRYGEAVP